MAAEPVNTGDDATSHGGTTASEVGVQHLTSLIDDGDNENNDEVSRGGGALEALARAVGRIEEKLDKVLRLRCGAEVRWPARAKHEDKEQGAQGVGQARMARWVSAKGFGFVRAAGVEAFVRCSAVSGNLTDLVKASLMVQLERDTPRGEDKLRVVRATRREEHEAVLAREHANRMAQNAVEAAQRTRRAMEVADDAALRSAWWAFGLLERPPGLNEGAVGDADQCFGKVGKDCGSTVDGKVSKYDGGTGNGKVGKDSDGTGNGRVGEDYGSTGKGKVGKHNGSAGNGRDSRDSSGSGNFRGGGSARGALGQLMPGNVSEVGPATVTNPDWVEARNAAVEEILKRQGTGECLDRAGYEAFMAEVAGPDLFDV